MTTDTMTRDGEIPAIFNPTKRVRTPSVVVTGENGPFSGFTAIPQITHSDSVTSSQPDAESLTCISASGHGHGPETPLTGLNPLPPTSLEPVIPQTRTKYRKCKDSCCSELAHKMYFGICVTVLVTASWVGASHCIKFLYMDRSNYSFTLSVPAIFADSSDEDDDNTTLMINTYENPPSLSTTTTTYHAQIFNAPFFASWFSTNFAILFFPIYLLGRASVRKCGESGEAIGDIIRGFRDRGFTISRFLNRCMAFCILWLITTYLYTLSLNILRTTESMVLFATNVACVYLLSWVILHEQFVGIRIVAVILCDTGIALLAYMDGITGSKTLKGVVLAILAAAGYGVFKVMFRKIMGDPPVGQIAFTFSMIGLMNAALLWPICLALYFSGTEQMPSDTIPWAILIMACVLMLVFHILTQFSSVVTYNMFITLGLITSVPVSAALDVILYGAHFAGMKLAGIILISVGFFLVMFPNNWPDYITRLLRKTGRLILRNQCCCDYAELDYENSKYHIVGTQREMGASSPKPRIGIGWPSPGENRLSNRLHPFASTLSIGQGEMTEQNFYHSSLNLSRHSIAETDFMYRLHPRGDRGSYGSIG